MPSKTNKIKIKKLQLSTCSSRKRHSDMCCIILSVLVVCSSQTMLEPFDYNVMTHAPNCYDLMDVLNIGLMVCDPRNIAIMWLTLTICEPPLKYNISHTISISIN